MQQCVTTLFASFILFCEVSPIVRLVANSHHNQYLEETKYNHIAYFFTYYIQINQFSAGSIHNHGGRRIPTTTTADRDSLGGQTRVQAHYARWQQQLQQDAGLVD